MAVSICCKCGKPIEPIPIEGLPNCAWGGQSIVIGGVECRYHDECFGKPEPNVCEHGKLRPQTVTLKYEE